MVLSSLLGVALAVFLFLWLPSFLSSLMRTHIPAIAGMEDGAYSVLRGVFEGVFRIVLFVGYMLLVSLMRDIRRVFMYHGAEHKAIFCYEAGEELTVENVRKQRRFHPPLRNLFHDPHAAYRRHCIHVHPGGFPAAAHRHQAADHSAGGGMRL